MFVFFLPIGFRNILIIPLIIRNTRLIVALAIGTGVPLTLVNELRKTPLFAPEKNKSFVCIVEYCDILIECLAHLFSAIKFSNGKIFYLFDSTGPEF